MADAMVLVNAPNINQQTSTNSTMTQRNEPDMKGWLFKWTNYLKGYQRRWFVLQNGVLSYYRAENNGGVSTLSIRRRRRFRNNGNQAEMMHTCRGSISLHGAMIYSVDACTFVISNGGTQTFHIRAASEVERQCWVTALELAKAKAIRTMESEDDEDEQDSGSGSPEEWSSVVRELQGKLQDLQTCSDLINKHGSALQRALSELESNYSLDVVNQDNEIKSKAVSERATLFRIASNAMINACSEYLTIAQTHGHKWTRLLQHEREQRQRLQEMVETLAQQHSKLEQAACANSNNDPTNPPVPVSASEEDDEENEFYDAEADAPATSSTGSSSIGGGNHQHQQQQQQEFTLNIPTSGGAQGGHAADSSSETDESPHETQQVVVRTVATTATSSSANAALPPKSSSAHVAGAAGGSSSRGGVVKRRRTCVPDKPNYPLNLWSIMKNCVGKDLSKIPMPVNFSEPLSMLQRLAEDFEYSNVLDVAATMSDPCEQVAYVAAFTISSYSTTSNRSGKPFNPLLGETYECDRSDDFGWRLVSEQVSHHPPMVAQHCAGKGWRCWQEFTMTTKFRGKYLQVIPLGMATVEFDNGCRYSWRKVTSTVHNIIVGKLWVDQHGDMEILGKGNAMGVKCHLKYIPYSYFSKESQRRVKGVVLDAFDSVKWIINGTWDKSVEVAPVATSTDPPSTSATSNTPTAATTPPPTSKSVTALYETGTSAVAWERVPPPPNADKFYNFTLLACQLNEMEEDVAPTDSRRRPDQRLMENQEWDKANAEKLRLEEKQRAVRRQRERDAEHAAKEGRPYAPYEPVWFKQVKDENDCIVHTYQNEYWEAKERRDWTRCPNIF